MFLKPQFQEVKEDLVIYITSGYSTDGLLQYMYGSIRQASTSLRQAQGVSASLSQAQVLFIRKAKSIRQVSTSLRQAQGVSTSLRQAQGGSASLSQAQGSFLYHSVRRRPWGCAHLSIDTHVIFGLVSALWTQVGPNQGP